MNATFSIRADTRHSLIRVVLSGFFLDDDIRRFADVLAVEIGSLGAGPLGHVSLVDIRGMKIQPQDSVECFARLLADPTLRARRIAFVVETGLARMQLERAAAGRGGRAFRDAEEAERWLLAADAPVALSAVADTPPRPPVVPDRGSPHSAEPRYSRPL